VQGSVGLGVLIGTSNRDREYRLMLDEACNFSRIMFMFVSACLLLRWRDLGTLRTELYLCVLNIKRYQCPDISLMFCNGISLSCFNQFSRGFTDHGSLLCSTADVRCFDFRIVQLSLPFLGLYLDELSFVRFGE
jgi:hypothetical protein